MSSEKQTFDYIWETAVYPAILFCVSEVDSNLKEKLGFEHKRFDEYKQNLSQMFNRKREWLKSKYLPDEGENARLDFHKLSALLCRCIIGYKFFSFNKTSMDKVFDEKRNDTTTSTSEKIKWQVNNVYVNYKLAFWASIGLIYVNLISWAYKKIETETDADKISVYTNFLKFLEQESNLISYKKSVDHDDFCTSMIVALMKNDCLLRDFDYLN